MSELYDNKSEWFNKLLAYIWSHFDINIDVKPSTYNTIQYYRLIFFPSKVIRFANLQNYRNLLKLAKAVKKGLTSIKLNKTRSYHMFSSYKN